MWDKVSSKFRRTYWVDEKRTASWLEFYTAITLGIVYLCNGLVRSYAAPALNSLANDSSFDHVWTSKEKTYIASIPTFAAIGGAVISSPIMKFLGRRKMMILIGVPHLVGWLLIGFAVDFPMMLAGRTLSGIGIGMSTPSVPIYVSECVRARYRGFFGYFPAMFEALGLVLGLLIVSSLGWKVGALVMSAFPILVFLLTFFLQESPLWLIVNERDGGAFDSLKKLRGEGRDEKVRKELDDLTDRVETTVDSWSKKPWYRILALEEVWWPFGVVVCLMIFQQMTGISAVINYMEKIILEADHLVENDTATGNWDMHIYGDTPCPEISSVIVATVQFAAFFIALPLIDSMGRRPLLVISASVVVVAQVCLGFFFHYAHRGESIAAFQTTAPWIVNLFLSAFIGGYSIGFACIPFIILSEVFPAQISCCLASLASVVNLSFSFAVVHYFVGLKDALPPGYVFWLFAAVTASSLILILFAIPETKGKSISQLQNLFVPASYSDIQDDLYEIPDSHVYKPTVSSHHYDEIGNYRR